MEEALSRRLRNKEGGWVALALLLAVCVLLALLLVPDLHQRTLKVVRKYFPYTERDQSTPAVKQESSVEWVADNAFCEVGLPRHGASIDLPDSNLSQKSTLHSRLFISNEHKFPIILILTDQVGHKRYQAISLHPGRGAQVIVPVGRYGVMAQVGRSWCNVGKGFRDGSELLADELLHIRDGEVAKLRLMSYGNEPKNLAFSFNRGLGVALADVGIRPEGHGKLDLQRHRGQFYVEGTVNQTPLIFLVDTGAFIVAVSRSFAIKAGLNLEECRYETVSTANGLTRACLTSAKEVAIHQFIFRNVEVAVADNLPGEALLGMNVISQFHVEQQGDVMRISLR